MSRLLWRAELPSMDPYEVVSYGNDAFFSITKGTSGFWLEVQSRFASMQVYGPYPDRETAMVAAEIIVAGS